MKWNVLSAALVVGVGVCSQSYGFELLDRMLGTGCGCAPCAAQACCEKPCGVAADPGCGCAVDPGCGCAVDPGCGCPTAGCGCAPRCRPRLFDSLFCGHRCRGGCAAPSCGCAADAGCGCPVDPGCGCAAAADCGCAAATSCCQTRCHRSLLDALFGCRRSRCGSGCGCGASACGGGCGCGEPVGGAVQIGDHDDAPMPPAPMADPNARLGRRSTYTQTSLIR